MNRLLVDGALVATVADLDAARALLCLAPVCDGWEVVARWGLDSPPGLRARQAYAQMRGPRALRRFLKGEGRALANPIFLGLEEF